MIASFNCRALGSSLLLVWLASLAFAQPKPAPAEPELALVTGVIKEVNASRRSIVYFKTVEGSYGAQQVTDIMFLHANASISLNGAKVPLTDLHPGDRVAFECLQKPERALRVAAVTREELEKLQLEKERIKEFEKKVEANHLRLLKELARKQFAKDLERDKEKAKAAAEKAKAGGDKQVDPAKKDPPKKDPPPN